MVKPRVLFVCSIHGGRSRIAEALTRRETDTIEPAAACLEPREIRGGLAREVMQELGIELPASPVPSVYQYHREQRRFDYVVSLCEGEFNLVCPAFNRNLDVLYATHATRIYWELPDFKELEGTQKQKLEQARDIRDEIHRLVRRLTTAMHDELASLVGA